MLQPVGLMLTVCGWGSLHTTPQCSVARDMNDAEEVAAKTPNLQA